MPSRKSQAAEIPLPWERLPNESGRVYAQFCVFRDMPYKDKEHDNFTKAQIRRGRSIKKTAKQIGCSVSLITKYSTRFNWRSRAEAYDDYVERELRERDEAEIRKMNKFHANAGRQLAAKALRGLINLDENGLSATDVVKMLDTGAKMERLARGQSTEKQQVDGHIEQEHSGGVVTTTVPVDLTQLTDEELDAFERICSKIQPAGS